MGTKQPSALFLLHNARSAQSVATAQPSAWELLARGAPAVSTSPREAKPRASAIVSQARLLAKRACRHPQLCVQGATAARSARVGKSGARSAPPDQRRHAALRAASPAPRGNTSRRQASPRTRASPAPRGNSHAPARHPAPPPFAPRASPRRRAQCRRPTACWRAPLASLARRVSPALAASTSRSR